MSQLEMIVSWLLECSANAVENRAQRMRFYVAAELLKQQMKRIADLELELSNLRGALLDAMEGSLEAAHALLDEDHA